MRISSSPGLLIFRLWLLRSSSFFAKRANRCRYASSNSHRDGPEEVELADFDTAVTENVVGGGEVKVEVWQRKVVEIVGTFHVCLLRPERQSDLAVGGSVDCPGVECLEKGERLGNARLELGDRLLIVLMPGRVDAGEPSAAILGLVAGDLHLAGEREHIGE